MKGSRVGYMREGITTIILTKNEEKNIRHAIASAWQVSLRILVIDCGSNDQTVAIAEEMGAEVIFHEWESHAKQFNWALDHCNIDTNWVFRLDADERVTEDLANEINNKIYNTNVDGFEVRWRLFFMNKWIRYGGTHRHYFLRLFRILKGRVEDRLIDERIVVNGMIGKLREDLIHYDYKGLDAWLNKHIWYSNLELMLYENDKIMRRKSTRQSSKYGTYYMMIPFMRAHLYYWYRYYLQLGFLDGREGKIFCFLQAYWYRFLVDAKIYERMLEKQHGTGA